MMMGGATPSRLRLGLALPLAALLAGCGGKSALVTGEISADGSCSASFDGTLRPGVEGGVRVVSQPADPAASEQGGGDVLVVYCRLNPEGEEPARIDFVKLDAPEAGVLEPGSYTVDTEGSQPRTIGVVITASEYLDVTRHWEPTRGTFDVSAATDSTLEATFEIELRARGARTY